MVLRIAFKEVVERLATIPERLPEPVAALMPVFTGPITARPAREPLDPATVRPAAVLVLLYPDDVGDARVVLTERVTRDGHHSGEVSFPGGRAEPGDADLVATALREAAEEVGLDAEDAGVRVVGQLERFWIPVSNYEVTPIVATALRRPRLEAAPDEVASILEPRLATFLPEAPIETVEQTIRGWELRFGAYRVDGLIVWGATARVLSQLGALLAR